MTRREDLLKQRPRSGPEYESAREGALRVLVHLRGFLTDEQIDEEAEKMLDVSWLRSLGEITDYQLQRETAELAMMAVARVRGQVGST